MGSRPDKRRMSRVQASIEVELRAHDGQTALGRLQDISVIGLRMTGARPWPPGTICRVQLRSADRDRSIEAQATVVRSDDEGMALRIDVLPYESFERLRSLLLANAADGRAVDDELSERLGYLTDES
jgi:hypothetical protein